MKKLLPVLFAMLPSISVAAAAPQNDINPSEPQKTWYGQELFLGNLQYGSSNPTSISQMSYSGLNDINISYSRNNGSFRPVDGALTEKLSDVSIYGLKKLERVDFMGSIEYGNHDLTDILWNGTVMTSKNNPFILADTLRYDSLTNDADRETFTLDGGMSFRMNQRITLGLEARYAVGSKADQSDPRLKANAARTTIIPGITYSVSDNFSIGLNLSAELYHENITSSVQDNMISVHNNVYILQELGKFEGKDALGYNRRYDGNIYGAALQFINSGSKAGNFAELSFKYNQEDAIDGGSSYKYRGGDFKEMSAAFNDRFQYKASKTIHNIMLDASMDLGSAKTYKQNSGFDDKHNTMWTIASSAVTQKQTDINALLTYRADFIKAGFSHMSASLHAGFEMNSVKEYPDDYYARYSLLNVGAEISKRFMAKDWRWQVSAAAGWTDDIKPLDFSLPVTTAPAKRFANSYFNPKYTYLASASYGASLHADASRRIKSGNWIKLGADASLRKYNGEGSRLDGTDRIGLKFSLGYIF